MFESRKNRLARQLQDSSIDACVLVPGPNLYYFTGLQLKQSERLTFAVITKENQLLFLVPQVELSKVESLTQEHIYWYRDEQGPTPALTSLKAALGTVTSLGIEHGVMRVMELKAAETLNATQFHDVSKGIDSLRMYKSEEEIEYFRKAVTIVEEGLHATLPFIKTGVTELEIAAQLEFEMRKRGSEGTPFGTIVASGYRGALPHGRASTKMIQHGELVVLDYGSTFGGYVADIARTVAVGEISTELKTIYDLVQKAQLAAVEKVRPGVTAHEIDEAARSIIAESGYGSFFTHRTGHGIGLNTHEEPYMMQNNQLSLQPGMSFTIEPGIYLPDKGGVRIEDNIIVTKDGYINLMSFTKDLITL